MPTTKGYSVSRSAGGGTGVSSDVYSYSGAVGGAAHCGRNGAYDHPDAASMREGGRQPTLMNGERAVEDFAVTAAAITTNADGPLENRNTLVTCTTTTIDNGAGNAGAGLIVQFTSTDADPTQIGAITIVEGGENYTSADSVVEVDGYPGSRLSVTAA
jgi:hypothetical protein